MIIIRPWNNFESKLPGTMQGAIIDSRSANMQAGRQAAKESHDVISHYFLLVRPVVVCASTLVSSTERYTLGRLLLKSVFFANLRWRVKTVVPPKLPHDWKRWCNTSSSFLWSNFRRLRVETAPPPHLLLLPAWSSSRKPPIVIVSTKYQEDNETKKSCFLLLFREIIIQGLIRHSQPPTILRLRWRLSDWLVQTLVRDSFNQRSRQWYNHSRTQATCCTSTTMRLFLKIRFSPKLSRF